MKSYIQHQAEELADLCLENAEIYHNYNDGDLENATLIFMHFLMDKIWSENKGLDEGKMVDLVETSGKALRELIKASTGKDMADVVRRNLN